MEYRGLILDSFQEEAFFHIQNHKSVIISAPTGSGKTVVAEYAIEKALQEHKEVIYTAPIKALSNQKFRDFSKNFGSENVGIMTGDVSYHSDAPVLIMTTEIFRNAIFEDPKRFDRVSYLVFDEVHYLDDVDRGSVWEESIIFAPEQIKVLCLSATVPNVKELALWIAKVRNDDVKVICEDKRPVPLQEMCIMNQGIITSQEAYRILPKRHRKNAPENSQQPISGLTVLNTILTHLHQNNQLPCLYFVFSRRECEKNALQCCRYQFLTPKEKEYMQSRFNQLIAAYNLQNSRLALQLGTLVTRGIAYHHAGMLPACKEIIEQLFTEGLIKLLFATETFALGINMPARSVVFDGLCKFDGEEVRCLKSLEYQQMSGRAGRRGIDVVGYVYGNIVGESFTSLQLKKIMQGPLEEISSQFNLSYSTLLSLYARLGMDVIGTYDKSFGAFHREIIAGDKRQKRSIHTEQRALVKKKLALMRNIGYIQDDGLTSKGRFATFINGYEIQLTELFFSGFLEDKDEAMLFSILVSLVFDGKSDYSMQIPKFFRQTSKQMIAALRPPKTLEQMLGLKSEIKDPDFSLTLAAWEWASGKPFSMLTYHNKILPGDVIRSFRQSIQICRQLRKACKGYESFIILLDRCLTVVNRDEVNALNQLQAFAELDK